MAGFQYAVDARPTDPERLGDLRSAKVAHSLASNLRA